MKVIDLKKEEVRKAVAAVREEKADSVYRSETAVDYHDPVAEQLDLGDPK